MPGIDRFPQFVTDLSEVALPLAGARAWLIQGDRQQVVFMEFSQAVEVPEHSHREQWEIVLSGSVLLRVGVTEREYRAGEAFFIPAGVPHSAAVRAGYRAAIVFNEPGRYRVK
jgi:quercetin dioxygenase-like cupin family protein